MKRIVIFLSLGFCLLTQCKTSRFLTSEKNSQIVASQVAVSQETKSLTLYLEDTKQIASINLSSDQSFGLHSPLSFLNHSYLDEAKKQGLNVVDFSSDLSMYNVSDSSLPPSSCYNVGIYSYLSASHKIQSFLLSSFSDKSASSVVQAVKLIDFQYCVKAKTVEIYLAQKSFAFPLLQYFEGRGFILRDSPQGLGMFGGKAVVGKAEIKIIEDYEGVVRAHESIHPVVPKPASAHASEDLLASWVHIEGRKYDFDNLTDRSMDDMIVGNRVDEEIYHELKLELGDANDMSWGAYFSSWTSWALGYKAVDKSIGAGAFAKVYKVQIRGKDYAVRVEKLSGDKVRDRGYASYLRTNYLVQNAFAKAHPDAGFIGVHLAFYSEKSGEFISVMELKSGGELWNYVLSKDYTFNSQKAILIDQLHNQLHIYHQGIPIVFKGKSYTLMLAHGDIKPQNVVLDEAQKSASFIDFGLSRLFVRDQSGNVGELVGGEIIPAVLSKNNAMRGTPQFKSPEFWKIIESGEQKTGADCLLIEMNADNYSANFASYLSIVQELPPGMPAQQTMENISKFTQSSVELRMDKERSLVPIQDVINEGTYAWPLFVKYAYLYDKPYLEISSILIKNMKRVR